MAHPPSRPARDSLELASLASSSNSNRNSIHNSIHNHHHHHHHLQHSFDTRASLESDVSVSALSSTRLQSEGDTVAVAAPSPRSPARSPRSSARSYSVSSAFNFNPSLFPLSASGPAYNALGWSHNSTIDVSRQGLEKNKNLTCLNGFSLVAGSIIGSGIFSSPASVYGRVGSPAAALLVWVVSGLLAWTGAASYAELGGAIPLNGGAQVYLSKIFGEWAGFLYTWCAVVVLKPGSAAIVSIVLGEYLVRACAGADGFALDMWITKAVAILGLLLITALNCLSTRVAARSTDVFMFFKLAALVVITLAGVIVAVTGLAYQPDQLSSAWKSTSWFQGTSTSSSQWAVALYAGLWAYDGWDSTNYVVGEMRHPARDLPRVIHSSILLVTSAYVLANLAYIFVLPAAVIRTSDAIAIVFGSTVVGPIGSVFLAIAVAGSCLGTLSASTFTCGRLTHSAAKEGYLPEMFATVGLSDASNRGVHIHRRTSHARWTDRLADEQGFFYTPIYAMTLNASLTFVYILIGDFGTLTTFYGVASYLFYFAAVVGLIVLRVKEPELERPYKCWITTPILFCCVSLFLLSRVIFAKPVQTLAVVGFISIGLPLYWWRLGSRNAGRKRGQTSARWYEFWKKWSR